jgi:hypothetical protein
MGAMKQAAITNGGGGLWTIGPNNPYLKEHIRVTWLKPWGGKPIGYTISGDLTATMAVNGGRTLVGILTVRGPYGAKSVSCPWSRHYLQIEL